MHKPYKNYTSRAVRPRQLYDTRNGMTIDINAS